MAKDGAIEVEGLDLRSLWGAGVGIGFIVKTIDEALLKASREGNRVTIEVPKGSGVEFYEEICFRGVGNRVSVVEVVDLSL